MRTFPLETLNLCKDLLKRRGNEGIYRSIVSRAYYAALQQVALYIHENCEELKFKEIRKLKKKVEASITKRLDEGKYCCNEKIARKIKRELNYLYKNYRRLADYRLELYITKIVAKRAVSKAEGIINLVKNC